ncbi:hypothetical protein AQ505_08810 [Pedobacter sp. PACM 27299]|uniref:hypothetical protein n=1 Tax=Pedobacter sp. PACM 27299 TaxID=1727164 RepID=UPI0007060197|nr:hypothetical protein [Pedobacter sp. PACM 27299]ALL05582.1 hypothetical protein AQ505_08810 [Pedobacter sp. PACM 27299]
MSQLELKQQAKKLRKEKKYEEALLVYLNLWENEKDAWTGYFIALCLRQTDQLVECREFHIKFGLLFPNFPQIKSELLWLNYKDRVKNYDNPDFRKDADLILSQTDKYNPETNKIFIKTVLAVAIRLSSYSFSEKLEWLEKLDQSILDNNVFRFNDIAYPADRKRYFLEYADALINLGTHKHYITEQMSKLNFTGNKRAEFLEKMIEEFTYLNWEGKKGVSKVKLARVLKNLSEEIHLRQKKNVEKAYIQNKTLSVSDLSRYLFCPVSYAINRTYKVYSSENWEKDEWKREKLYLGDRYRKFYESKKFEDVFKDTKLEVTQNFKEKFQAIFDSKIELNNVTTKEPRIMTSHSKNMKGAPDYIFLHPKGNRFVLTEKFSHYSSSDYNNPFESDLIKHYAFLQEFTNYHIHFGLFLTWYYTFQDVEDGKEGEKEMVISHYRLIKVKLDPKRIISLNSTIEKLKVFSKDAIMMVDGEKLSQPKKCLNCSVISYCHHKTGQFNKIELPYELMPLQDNTTPKTSEIRAEDDLPF